MLTKWVAATGISCVLATILVRVSQRTDTWVPRTSAADVSAGRLVLTLNADTAVHGWTRWSRPRLVVECDPEQGVHLSMTTGIPVETESGSTRTVSLQFDDEDPVIAQWIPSSDRQTLRAPAPAAPALVARFSHARRFSFAFLPLRADPVVARFSVSGFARHWGAAPPNCAHGRLLGPPSVS